MNRLTVINVICLGICFFVAVKAQNELNADSTTKTSVVDPRIQPVYVKAGDPFELKCTQSDGLTLEWLKDTVEIDTGSGLGFFTVQDVNIGNQKTESTLSKTTASLNDTGRYVCQPEGSPENSYNVQVNVFSFAPRHATAEKPRVDVELRCEKDGLDGGDKIKWYKGDTLIMAEENKYEIDDANNTLTVMKVVEGDEGEYICNLRLNNNEEYNTTVNLYLPPQVHHFQKSRNIIQGDPLQMDCKAYGWPTPSIQWLKAEEPLDMDDERIKLSNYTTDKQVFLSNATLRINNLDFDDRAEYACVASVEMPDGSEVKSNATILVRVKDKLAALWPFLGICAEVAILCAIIFIYEKRRAKKMEEEERREEADHLTNSHAHRGENDEIRQRK